MSRPARSLLFVPGDRPERFEKAAASGAHQIILDLEDAVAPDAKASARAAVAAWLAARGRDAASPVVRVNGADTEWHALDLQMLRAHPGAVVMLAKAEPASLALSATGLPQSRFIALLETVRGFIELRALAQAERLDRIAFGSVDFAVESGIQDEGEALTAVRTRIALESVHARLAAPIDGVSVEFNDAARIRADALRSRALGFGAKLCIHPRQVAPVNDAWRPTPDELAWAQRVLGAFERSGGAATALDGKMIDKPVVERARRIQAEAASGAP